VVDFQIDPEFEGRLDPPTPAQLKTLAEKIKEEGCLPGSLVVGSIQGDMILVDGHNTFTICKKLGIPLCDPVIRVFESRQSAMEWMDKNQVARRNVSEEYERELRRRRVVTARIGGNSLPAIAHVENISVATVRRDLEASGLPGGANLEPSNGKVTGQDGKEYPVSTKRTLCPSCATRVRKGQAVEPKCRECRNLRKAKKADKGNNPDADPPEPEEKIEPMDDLGSKLPRRLRDAFAGNRKTLGDGVKLLQEVRRMCKNLVKWNPFLRGDELEKTMANLCEDLKNGLPYAVCAFCEGKGDYKTNNCKHCRNAGWMPKWAYKGEK
jgi:hypothetical protein